MKDRNQRLFSSITYLNATQFMGALNDNVYKLLIIFLLIHLKGVEHSNTIIALSGLTYVLPFLLFSLPSGVLADHYSKKKITVATKALELIIMIGGVVAFGLHSAWGAYAVLFMMATQSAVFGPAKYGMVPEIVAPDKVAKANGSLTAFTVLAAIVGTFLASFLVQITDHNFILSSAFCVIISLIGFITSLCIETTPPAGSKQRFRIFFIADIFRILRKTREENYLMNALFGSAFFYLVGAFIQLNIIPFGMQSLDITDVQGGYLFLTASVGIAIGAPLAGKLCGKFIELGLAPIAGIGMTLFLLLLAGTGIKLESAIPFFLILGLFGGVFLVPFDSFIQVASPSRERGQNLSVSNFLAFLGVLVSSGLLALFGNVLKMSAAQGFFAVGILTGIVTLLFAMRLRDTFLRLISRILTRNGKRLGISSLPALDVPSTLICRGASWQKSVLILSAIQQRYMRFLVERPKSLSYGDRLFAFLAKVRFYNPHQKETKKVEHWLKRGYNVCILTGQEELETRVEIFKSAMNRPVMAAILTCHLHTFELDLLR